MAYSLRDKSIKLKTHKLKAKKLSFLYQNSGVRSRKNIKQLNKIMNSYILKKF